MAEVRTVVPTGLGDTGLEVSWEIHTHCSCSRWRAHTTAQLWWGKETNIPWAATLQTSGAFHASSRLILTMILQGRTSLRAWYSEKECTHLESKSRDRAIQLEAWGSPLPPPPPTPSPRTRWVPYPPPGSLFHPHQRWRFILNGNQT